MAIDDKDFILMFMVIAPVGNRFRLTFDEGNGLGPNRYPVTGRNTTIMEIARKFVADFGDSQGLLTSEQVEAFKRQNGEHFDFESTI